MNFEQIEIFLAIVDKKNLSKAAASLFLSQSTMSHRLKALEKDLDMVLFQRKRGQRTLELTPQGIEFVDIAERWMSLWKETQRLQSHDYKPRLAIGAVASLNQHILPPLFHKLYQSSDPKVNLSIKSSASQPMYLAIENHELDVGFTVQLSMYSNITGRALFAEEQVLIRRCSPREVTEAFREDIHPKSLDPEKEIIFNFHPDYMHWHNKWWDHFRYPKISIGHATGLILHYLDEPDSWVLIPKSIAMDIKREDPTLSLHHLTEPAPERICYMVTHRVPRSGKERSMELLEQCLHELISELEQQDIVRRL